MLFSVLKSGEYFIWKFDVHKMMGRVVAKCHIAKVPYNAREPGYLRLKSARGVFLVL